MDNVHRAAGQWKETFRVQGDHLADRVRELIHEGTVRHLIIRHGDATVLEIPVTLGVLGAVLAPTLAAVAAVGAMVTDCTVEVIRTGDDPAGTTLPPA